jgi:hypothetical protein
MNDEEYQSGSDDSLNWDELCDINVLYSASGANGASDINIRKWN